MKRIALRDEDGKILEFYDPFAPGSEPQQIEFDADKLILTSYNQTFAEHEREEKFNTPEFLEDVLDGVFHHVPDVDCSKFPENRQEDRETIRVCSATIEECCDNCGLLSDVCAGLRASAKGRKMTNEQIAALLNDLFERQDNLDIKVCEIHDLLVDLADRTLNVLEAVRKK